MCRSHPKYRHSALLIRLDSVCVEVAVSLTHDAWQWDVDVLCAVVLYLCYCAAQVSLFLMCVCMCVSDVSCLMCVCALWISLVQIFVWLMYAIECIRNKEIFVEYITI